MKSGPAAIQVFDASRNSYGYIKNSAVQTHLARRGIGVTRNPRDASIVVAETRRQLLRGLLAAGVSKPGFLYTDEPSFDTTTARRAWLVPGLKRFEAMNVFTGDVFTDASFFLERFGLQQPIPALTPEPALRQRFDSRRVAAFLTFRPANETRRIVAGRNIDLNARRIQIALAGHARGVTDIFGAGFAPGIVVDSTGWGHTQPGEEWWDVKHRTLATRYAFNLCAENTDWPHYVTEKIWQSIRADCLPVYLGKNNGVRALFPPDSYVEITDFAGEAELFDFLRSLPFEEFLSRVKKCRATYEHLLDESRAGRTDSDAKRIERLADRLLAVAR